MSTSVILMESVKHCHLSAVRPQVFSLGPRFCSRHHSLSKGVEYGVVVRDAIQSLCLTAKNTLRMKVSVCV